MSKQNYLFLSFKFQSNKKELFSWKELLLNLKERVIVITGASSGIGEAMARQFGEAGAGVVLLARRYEPIEEIANQINDKGGLYF